MNPNSGKGYSSDDADIQEHRRVFARSLTRVSGFGLANPELNSDRLPHPHACIREASASLMQISCPTTLAKLH